MPAEKTAMISEINGSKFLFSCQVTRAELEIEGELQGFQTDIVRLDLMQSRSTLFHSEIAQDERQPTALAIPEANRLGQST